MKSKLFTAVALSLALGRPIFGQSPSPTVIPFQGQLTNQTGVAYTGGQYTITFNLYDGAVGGTSKWTERHQKVGVINGLVNVFLGSIQPFTNNPAITTDDVDFSQVKYLGITIDADDNPSTADPEMVPRQMIIPAVHSKTTEKMVAFNSTTGVPLASFGWGTLFDNGDPATGRISGSKLANASVGPVQLSGGMNQLVLPTTTAAGIGAVTLGGQRFMHGFGGGTYLGDQAGNFGSPLFCVGNRERR